MPTHAYNFGVRTSAKGVILEGVRLTGLTVGTGSAVTIAEDCRSNLFASVVHTATGVYTFNLNVPFPPKLMVCSPELSAAAGAAIISARYQNASYNATTGVLIVNTSNTSGTATDPGANDEMHVIFLFRLYTT